MIFFLLGGFAFFPSMREIRHINAGRDLSQAAGYEMLRLEAAVNRGVLIMIYTGKINN
ncbi:MAG: hypothetical protein FWG27_06910 [Treponema sp.]|nr:hypothetical protein [Treponema sp.]